MSDIRDHLESTFASTDTVLRGVNADDWAKPSICEEWTIRQLVEHLVGSCALTAAVLSAQESPGRPAYADTADDRLAAEFAQSGRVVLDALSNPAVLTQKVTVGLGPSPGQWLRGCVWSRPSCTAGTLPDQQVRTSPSVTTLRRRPCSSARA